MKRKVNFSVISPEIFRVIVPPELIELSKRLALLPRDIARVINGLAHLPFDLMRAIAVLDDTTQIGGETITYYEMQKRIISGEDIYTGEPMATTNTTTNATNTTAITNNTTTATVEAQESKGQPAEVKEGVEGEESSAEEAPGKETEPPKPPEIPPELSGEHNVLKTGEEFFIEVFDDTGKLVKKTFTDPVLMSGGENAEAYNDLMTYGQNMVNEVGNLSQDLGEDATYTTYADGYKNSVTSPTAAQAPARQGINLTGDLAQDLEIYQKDRENLDNMLKDYAKDGVITPQEAEELRRETDRVRREAQVIYEGVGKARDALIPKQNVPPPSFYSKEVADKLIGEDLFSGLSQELLDYLQDDKNYLDERYRNLGGT